MDLALDRVGFSQGKEVQGKDISAAFNIPKNIQIPVNQLALSSVLSKMTLFLALMALTVQGNRRKASSILLEGRMSLTSTWSHGAVLREMPKVAFFLLSSATGL